MATNWTLQEKIIDLNKQYSKYVLNECSSKKEHFQVRKEPSGLITLYKDERPWLYSYDILEVDNELNILIQSIYSLKH